MAKKYQVFVSSTYTDLIEERKKAQEILLMADCIPAGMEAFVATNDEQFNVIKKVIDLCDYYVLIIGGRYGSINESTGKSYTEMEYDYAIEKGVPVLVFAIDSSVEIPDDKKDSDVHNLAKLEDFKRKAMNNRLASVWKDETDLAGKMAVSIMKAKTEIVRPGWTRAGESNEELLEKINAIRDENDLLKEKLKTYELTSELSSDDIETDDLAFENTPIKIHISEYYNPGYDVDTTLEELFVVTSSRMLSGKISMDDIKQAISNHFITELAHNNDVYLDDDISILRYVNQYKLLGLISKTSNGFELTPKGERKLDEVLAIYKETK